MCALVTGVQTCALPISDASRPCSAHLLLAMRRPAHLRRVARKIATIIGAPAEMAGLTVDRIQAGGIRLGDVAVDMSCRECGVSRWTRLLRLGSRRLAKTVRRLDRKSTRLNSSH